MAVKQGLAALELPYLVKEASALVGARLDGIRQLSESEFSFSFYVRNLGTMRLVVSLPSYVFLAAGKGEGEWRVSGFCSRLKSILLNARLTAIQQLGNERILELTFSKSETFSLFVELFSKGNLLLCDKDRLILSALRTLVFKDRSLKAGERYALPPPINNPFGMEKQEFFQGLKSSGKESVVKALALDFGLGGKYAEECCLAASVDKGKKPADVSAEEAERVFSAVQGLVGRPPAPEVVRDGVVDAVPFPLLLYATVARQPASSFSEAIAQVLKSSQPPVGDARTGKLQRIISEQEAKISELREGAELDRRRGELMYENYALVQGILEAASQAWKENRLAAFRHPGVKSVSAKDGKITVELE
ncbi:MAG: NFACT family protein [Candidatus Aenigmarchaeota archaeon]|nr:NFACT family protein [Candidatus Aenigmarchaeota archaeon]